MTRPGTQVFPRRRWPFLLGSGVLVVTAGVVMAVWFSVAFVRRGETVGGLDLPFLAPYPTVTDILLTPFLAFLVGGCLTFLGEILRRGAIVRGYGTNVALFRPLALATHALWIAVPVAAWVAVVPVVLSQSSTGSGAGSLSYVDADSDVAFLVGVYGGLAAALAGAVVGSLVKKAWYLRTVRRLGPPDPEKRSQGWWTFSYCWRGDVWLVALGGLLLGISPLTLFVDSTVGPVVTIAGGTVLVVVGLVTSTMYRRSGMPLGTGSSLTGGASTEPR